MPITSDRLRSVFANDTYQIRFIAAALEQLLGAEKTEAILDDMLPASVAVTPKFKGQPVTLFNGLSRDQLKRLHDFTDADVDEVYALLGVKEQTEAPAVPDATETPEEAAEDLESSALEEGESEASVDATVTQTPPQQSSTRGKNSRNK